MSRPCPHHCPPEGAGGIAAVLAVAGVGIAVYAALRAAARAIETAIEITVVAAGSAIGVAAIAGIAVWVIRAHKQVARKCVPAAQPTAAVIAESRAELEQRVAAAEALARSALTALTALDATRREQIR
jgi:hypothetical protein